MSALFGNSLDLKSPDNKKSTSINSITQETKKFVQISKCSNFWADFVGIWSSRDKKICLNWRMFKLSDLVFELPDVDCIAI